MIEWWNKKNEPNVLFIEYELMKAVGFNFFLNNLTSNFNKSFRIQ